MSFVTYDLIFLGIFILGVIIFLSSRKKNLKREGILYLYKTKVGIRFIEKFSKKFESVLKPARYLVVATGYVLMGVMIWLLGKTVYIYFKYAWVRETIRAPPVAPLIPYFPQIFGLESFFPPLYFTYFLIALAVVVVAHEFSHGIFARLHGFRIKSTGFAFLGPVLGAFVEPDEKQMEKSAKFPQLSVLAAGVFANLIAAIIFGLIMLAFFTSAFAPAGVIFNTYATSQVNMSEINFPMNMSLDDEIVKIESAGKNYFIPAANLQTALAENWTSVVAYDDSPAFDAKLEGAITEISGEKTASFEKLVSVLETRAPGDKIVIKTAVMDGIYDTNPEMKTYEIELSERNGKAFLGIGFLPAGESGIIGWLYSILEKIKNPVIYYECSLGDFGWFVYYLLWWIVVIDLLVALFNMLPLGILDGGRFFYLTIWGLTGSEKIGKKTFEIATWAILGVFVLLLLKWAAGFF